MFRKILAAIVVSFSVFGFTVGTASACNSVQNPLKEWVKFSEYLINHYNYDSLSENGRMLAFGHALGRVALAVEGRADRRQAFDCISATIEIGLLARSLNFPSEAIALQELMQEASWGARDREVADITGVTDNSPLYSIFGASGPSVTSNPVRGGGSGGRNNQGAGGGGAKIAGVIVKSQPGQPYGLPSTRIPTAGSNVQCTRARRVNDPRAASDFWSLANAAALFLEIRELQIGIGDEVCIKGNFETCRDIANLALKAQDEVHQVFDQNHDGINQCRMCNYDNVIAAAENLAEIEDWLYKRFYRAGGLGNTVITVRQRAEDPLCKAPNQQNAINNSNAGNGGTSGGGSSGAATQSAQSTQFHPCDLKAKVSASASWSFAARIYGAGPTHYERGGYICQSSKSYLVHTGGALDRYVCEKGYKNCKLQPDPEGKQKITKSKTDKDGSKVYYFDGGKQWARVRPK